MQYTRKSYGIKLGIILFCLWGCAFSSHRITPDQARSQIERAEAYVTTIRNLSMPLGDEFATATARLSEARTALADNEPETAYRAAQESATASRRLLNQFYHNTVAELARRARQELEQKKRQDPENPLTEHIPALDRMSAHAGSPEKAPQTTSLRKVLDDLDQVLKITAGVKNSWHRPLKTDRAFDMEKYDLSERGKAQVRAFAQEIAAGIRQAYPDQPVTVAIRVIGYTDQLNFGVNTPLVRWLTRDADGQIPDEDPARRQFLNRRLSEFRARTVVAYLAKLLGEAGNGKTERTLRREAIGRGEAMPPNLPSPYPASDPRRRICKIHVYAIPR